MSEQMERKDAAEAIAAYQEYLSLIDQMMPLAAQLSLSRIDCMTYLFNSLEQARKEVESRIAALQGDPGGAAAEETYSDDRALTSKGAHGVYR
jgi:hypothetical protein